MSEATFTETRKQHARVGVTQSFNASITTTGVETVVAPNIDVIKKGILIRYVAKLGSGLGGVSTKKNLNQSLTLSSNYYWSCWHTLNGVY
jgi:hypothetical protein